MRATFKIKTLGCPVNQHEGRALRAAMEKAGFTETDGVADIYIINSCVVTQSAAAEARRMATMAKRENPQAVVALAGCYPQVYWQEIKENLPQVDIIIGTKGRAELPAIISQRLNKGKEVPRVYVNEHHERENFEELPVAGNYGRTRPVIKIQEGCDETCTYCIVRKARGLPRSLAPEKVVAQVKHFVEKGYREVILAGNHLGAYGKDLPGWNLARIIQEINVLPYSFRIRLNYIEPMDITGEFIETLARTEKVCPFLYLPLQSGSDRILKKMGRRYTAGDFARLVAQARKMIPGLSVWTDLIAGFPGETEQDHRTTMALVKELGLTHLHVFPYSPRPATEAANFPNQVAPDIKKKRVKELRALDKKLAFNFHQQLIGNRVQVLVERVGNNYGEGFSENYVKVRFPATDVGLKGLLLPVKILVAQPWGVEGLLTE